MGKIRENRLRWYDHVMRRNKTQVVGIFTKRNVEGKRGTGGSKKRRVKKMESYKDMRV